MKRTALIGHRGVGKTSLLSRIERYHREAGREIKCIDLDQEIEKASGRSVTDIFSKDGEAAFRELERKTFSAISTSTSTLTSTSTSTSNVVVSLGAGFDITKIPPDWHVTWIRRATDEAGRIFTDRPRLDPNLSAIEEYKQRAHAREPKFAARADAVLILDEGIDETNDPAERAYFLNELNLRGATLTLQAENFARDFNSFIMDRLKWNLRWFELRDDLLTSEQIEEALKLIPKKYVLLSFRNRSTIDKTKALVDRVDATDWALELGDPQIEPTFVSLHEGPLEKLNHPRAILKAALSTANFADLMRGHEWQKEDPLKRVFLPMSGDGRWSWYRNQRRDYKLNFVRESAGSASDQPTLLQWQRGAAATFAAVLGEPVKHSRTPMEHREFFAPRAVYAIRVSETEFETAILKLIELGLTHAAITSPLKENAQALAKTPQPVNTLAFTATGVASANTDRVGLQEASKKLPEASKVVWGGGGTLPVLRQVFPDASFVSVRTKLDRDTSQPAPSPELVIWAATSQQSDAPPAEWRPRYIFDLNYSEASAAREYAQKTGAVYISGLAMFKAQAQAQREFWENL